MDVKTITLNEHPNGYDFIFNVNPKLYSRIKYIQSLDIFDKTKIYMHYYITQLTLKHNFKIVDALKNKGWGKPDKRFKNITFYYLWKNIKIMTTNEFLSDTNIEIRDCGEDWKEKGFAQRWWFNNSGIYDWFWKFKNEIEKIK